MEAVIGILILATPWPFGSTEPYALFGTHVAVAILLLLWSIKLLIDGRTTFYRCPFLLLFTFWILLAGLQLLPLPSGILQVVSPHTWETNQQLLPEKMERLPSEATAPAKPEAFPLSLAPGESRTFLIRLIVLFMVYLVLRMELVSKESYRRLAWVTMLNGVALSFVGIAQFISSPPNTIYWQIVTDGTVFGPFVCRNHFPFYAYLSLGLGFALLPGGRHKGRFWDDPSAIWVLTSLGILLAGIGLSLSRGAILATSASLVVCGWLWFRVGKPSSSLTWLVWLVPVVAVVLAWVGTAPIEQRLGTFQQGKQLTEGRWEMWKDSLRLTPSFWLFGTGNGTYEWIDAAQRSLLGSQFFRNDHAHNEYVQALVEGGIIRLLLLLAMIVVVVRTTVRQFRKYAERTLGRLLLGSLFGLCAVALHSIVDFGMQIPAIALVVVIVTAFAMGASDKEPILLGRFSCTLLAIFSLGLALLLVWEGWRMHMAFRYHRAAEQRLALTEERSLQERIQYLQTAIRLEPESARYQHELAQAFLDSSKQQTDVKLKQDQLQSALFHWRAARNLAPIMPQPHARLATYRDSFVEADSALTYFARAKSRMPIDPDIWYFSGEEAYRTKQFDFAWSDWQHSLQTANKHLSAIVSKAMVQLSPEAILEKVLPPRADVITAAIPLVATGQENEEAIRKRYAERALPLVVPTSAQEYRLQGSLLAELGRIEEAMQAYQQAFRREPNQRGWRHELAQALYRNGQLNQAKEELKTILFQDPNDTNAQDLLRIINREIQLKQP